MDFQTDVLERSHSKPVLVDFWAPWCGPCKVLGPTLEDLAVEQEEKWELVKLNTEEDPELAARYHVRSIPNVKLFYNGEVIGEFVGALPRTAIEGWLKDHLPDASRQSLDSILSKADHWPAPELIPLLETYIEEHPDNRDAMVALARERVLDHPEEALKSVEDLQYIDDVDDVRALAELLTIHTNGDEAPLERASNAVKGREFEQAIHQIIEAVKTDKNAHDELPRRAGVALFRLLRNPDPAFRNYRRLFDMLLT